MIIEKGNEKLDYNPAVAPEVRQAWHVIPPLIFTTFLTVAFRKLQVSYL